MEPQKTLGTVGKRRLVVAILATLSLTDEEIAIICKTSVQTIRTDIYRITGSGARPLKRSLDSAARTTAYQRILLQTIPGLEESTQNYVIDILEPEQSETAKLFRSELVQLRHRLKVAEGLLALAKKKNNRITVSAIPITFTGRNRNGAWNEHLSERCIDLPISAYSASRLETSGIEFVWQLCEKTEPEMVKILGRKGFNEVQEILGDLELSLKMDLSEFPRIT